MVMFRKLILVILLLLFLPLLVNATENDCVYYFYGDKCEHCTEANSHIKEIENNYPDLSLHKYEVYYNKDNYNLLRNHLAYYKIPLESQKLPMIFFSGSYLVGSDAIKELLEGTIKENNVPECPVMEDKSLIGVVGSEKSDKNLLESFSFFSLTGSALVNTFYPNIMLALLVLLTFIIIFKNKEVLIKKSLIYIGGIYLAFFVYGIGLFGFLGNDFFHWVYKIIALIIFISALIMIIGFFISWKLVLGNYYKKIKDQKVLWKKVSSDWGIFIFSLILGFLTVSQMHPTFGLLRSIFTDGYDKLLTLPFLIYYLILLFLLLLVILLVVYFLLETLEKKALDKKELKKIHLWNKHFLKIFNLIISVVLFILSLIIIFL